LESNDGFRAGPKVTANLQTETELRGTIKTYDPPAYQVRAENRAS
jgi:hypothetical protein